MDDRILHRNGLVIPLDFIYADIFRRVSRRLDCLSYGLRFQCKNVCVGIHRSYLFLMIFWYHLQQASAIPQNFNTKPQEQIASIEFNT
jgi:hypothetical protein